MELGVVKRAFYSFSIFESLNSSDMIMCYLCDSFKTRKKESGQVLGVCEGPNLLLIMSKVGVPPCLPGVWPKPCPAQHNGS